MLYGSGKFYYISYFENFVQLVRFYTRMGFKVVREVDGSSVADLSHMLVWGGKGTRMNANVEDLFLKWCTVFKPRNPKAERQLREKQEANIEV